MENEKPKIAYCRCVNELCGKNCDFGDDAPDKVGYVPFLDTRGDRVCPYCETGGAKVLWFV